MTINITGNQTDFHISIVTDGEKCSVMTTDANGISIRTGKILIKEDEKPVSKTKAIETTEKYDKDGKIVEKITIEETSEGDTVYESGSIYYPQEPKKKCCDCKCELKAEDIIKTVNDYCRRTGKGMFPF